MVPEEYTTYFRSVIVFGRIRILREEREKYAAIEKLAAKDMPDGAEEDRCSVIMREWKALCMLELAPEYISWKAAIAVALCRHRTMERFESIGPPGFRIV